MFNKKTHLMTVVLLGSIGLVAIFPVVGEMQALAADQPSSSLPKSVTVLGKTLELKDSKGGGPGEKFIAEYIPGNETFDNWSLMFATRYVPGPNLDPMVSATATARRILARKENGDPVANAAVFKAPDNKSAVVDFLMSSGGMIEHDVFRYFPAAKGLVSFQIARSLNEKKSSDQQVQDFIKSIKTRRAEILNEIMRSDLPVGGDAK